ncbi:MAG: GIN domain-containing protein [Bacteroidales bacterium]
MQIKSILITLVCSVITIQANAQLFKKVVGNDSYTTREFKVNDFSKVTITHPFNVVYKVNPDSAGYVSVYGEENILDIISMKSEKGNLAIKMNGMRTPDFGVVLIHMYSSSLSEVLNEGSATFEVASPIESTEIKFSVIGSGQIKAPQTQSGVLNLSVGGGGDILVGGTTGMGDYSISGSGEIRAAQVKADEVKAVITGTGNINCHAEKELKTVLTGKGKVAYTGTPELKNRTIGTGQVVPASN